MEHVGADRDVPERQAHQLVVVEHDPVGPPGEFLELVLPAGTVRIWEVDLAHDVVVDQLAELVLAADVPVDRSPNASKPTHLA